MRESENQTKRQDSYVRPSPKQFGRRERYAFPKPSEYRKAALGVFYKLAHDQDLSGTVQLQAANAMLDRTEEPTIVEPKKPIKPDLKDKKLTDEDLLNLIFDLQQRLKSKD